MFLRIFRFLRCLTWRRFINLSLAVCDYMRMLCGLKPHTKHKPVFLSVEPANTCNLKCPQCAVGRAKTHPKPQMMTTEMLDMVLKDTCATLLEMNFFFQGEPLLNRNLPELINTAHRKGIYTLCSTNAQTLTAKLAEALVNSGLDRLVVSMDGHTQAAYGQYRVGGDVQRVYDAMRYINDAKKRLGRNTPVVELQCLLLSSTENSLDFFRTNYRRLGADTLTFKTAQFYDYEHGNPLMPTNERHRRYRLTADGTYRIKGRLKKHCWRVVAGAVVDANGGVRPCCFDKIPQHLYGNLHDNSFGEIWRGDKAMSFRQAVLTHRPEIEICQNCTNV